MIPLLLLLIGSQNLTIEAWLNKEEPLYRIGEKIKIFFKANKDCYLAVYNIEVGGEENLLFPEPGGNGYVKANEVYEIPRPDADFEYEITGPEGTERIILIASINKLPDIADTSTEDISRKELSIIIEEPEPAKLRIISIPPKSRIYIEDVRSGEEVYVGRTPRTIVLKPGEYIITIKKSGYCPVKRRVRLEPEERRKVYVRLLPW